MDDNQHKVVGESYLVSGNWSQDIHNDSSLSYFENFTFRSPIHVGAGYMIGFQTSGINQVAYETTGGCE